MMNPLRALLRNHAGVVRTAHLQGIGMTASDIRRAVTAGRLFRVRKGWYAAPSAPEAVVTAVRAGGALTGSAALRHRGLWVPNEEPFQVRANQRSKVRSLPLPSRDGFRRPVVVEPYALPVGRALPVRASVDPVPIALTVAMLSRPRDIAVLLADSALHQGVIAPEDLAACAAHAGDKGRRALSLVTGTAESGTETLLRLWLVRHRVGHRAQAWICPHCRVDFLIGGLLVVEVDSREHHADPQAYARDRARDRRLQRMGYRVVRLTYAEVMYGLDRVGEDLLAMIRRGMHLGRPETRAPGCCSGCV
ncbi:type IV toxin-antitoxin system AbiEi family antitoxin domain-containing protein [Gulosibacter sp. 10]|uniref:type IV toxin-antitoxin system AbiEi family antitoxin domain-containing protein n=1 Tax=Gulosibacter sp. 10 TaxID=1255570 RepID=UPI000B35EA77|nr:type IV toxin-antitoxin system AbiEi family antitoxin domain-containing protein [Gulosibacter sp. 10]